MSNPDITKIVSNLLSCPQSALEAALCQRINFVRGEKFVVPLNMTEAAGNRDAFAKAMYPYCYCHVITFVQLRSVIHLYSRQNQSLYFRSSRQNVYWCFGYFWIREF